MLKLRGNITSAYDDVLTPRVLFPQKPRLNDSKLTSALLGIEIDQDTSIGIGYVAEAHLHFGFPALLLPLFLLGMLKRKLFPFFLLKNSLKKGSTFYKRVRCAAM